MQLKILRSEFFEYVSSKKKYVEVKIGKVLCSGNAFS